MTKGDLMWVLIRAMGFLLALRATLYIPEIISNGAWLLYLGDVSGSESEAAKMSFDLGRRQLTDTALMCAIYVALGFYFLRKGAWVYRLLNFAPSRRSNSTVEKNARKDDGRPSP